MKRFLTTSAIVACLGLPAVAEQHSAADKAAETQMDTMGIKASNLIDMRLFMPGGDTDTNPVAEITEVPDSWQMVGNIRDLVITENGEIEAVLVDAGGYLGMRENARQISMDNLRFVTDQDDEGAFFVVFDGDHSKFEQQAQYDSAQARSQGMMRASENEMMARNFADAPQMQERPVEWNSITTEDLLGTAVYGPNDEWIGDLSELSLTGNGDVDGVIIDVGGFLGIGEKPVEVSVDEIDIRRTGWDELRAYVSATEEELESMDTWMQDAS